MINPDQYAAAGPAPSSGVLEHSGPCEVKLEQTPSGQWRLLKNGEPYTIQGAGGTEHLEDLVRAGGNTLRTWGIEQLEAPVHGERLMDKAHRLGLMVMVGIWIKHPRHGADYGDEHFLREQRERVRASVREYRNHPALLIWGLGNEMEEDGEDPRVWRELEELAKIVKAEDGRHPICTVIAGTHENKVSWVQHHLPTVDLLGVNLYAGAEKVAEKLADRNWDRPYLLTEFGPVGHWEIQTTAWGAPIEPSSAEKARAYRQAHAAQFTSGKGHCLGTFCFIWGHKQETTATWFGMFLASGERTPAVDAMSQLWTGEAPAHPAPVLHGLRACFNAQRATGGTEYDVHAEVEAPDLTSLSYEWQVVAETHDRRSGGDAEEAPPIIPDCVVDNRGNLARIRIPNTPGAYRVFLYVRDGQGGGAGGNFPFYAE